MCGGSEENPMASTLVDPVRAAPLHPAHAFFLAAMVPLFLGAVLSDYAYTQTYEVQWSNFASWLIAGALVFGGLAIVCESWNVTRAQRRSHLGVVGLIVLVPMWVIGLIDAFVHSRDAWATMPTGLALSIVVLVLAAIATWLGFARPGRSLRP